MQRVGFSGIRIGWPGQKVAPTSKTPITGIENQLRKNQCFFTKKKKLKEQMSFFKFQYPAVMHEMIQLFTDASSKYYIWHFSARPKLVILPNAKKKPTNAKKSLPEIDSALNYLQRGNKAGGRKERIALVVSWGKKTSSFCSRILPRFYLSTLFPPSGMFISREMGFMGFLSSPPPKNTGNWLPTIYFLQK